MATYLLRRLLIAIPSLLGISLILFTVLALAPGDPFSEMATNPNVPPEVREALRTGLFFELAGIQQGKTFYKTLKDFKEGNGTTISGNGGTTSGNDSGTTPGGDNGGNTPGGNDNPDGIE